MAPLQAIYKSMIGAILMVSLVGACSEEKPPAALAVAVSDTNALTVKERIVPDYKPVAAILTNRDVGDARARIGGTLTRLLVREGDHVKRGQALAIVADQRLALEAQASASSVIAAQAQAERARADLARTKYLFEKGVYAKARMDSMQAEANSAEANLAAAKAQKGASMASSDQGRVVAPADGKVTRAPIPQGAVVLPGDVVVAISTGARVLRLELPEQEAQNIRQGAELRLVQEDATNAVSQIVRVKQVYPAVEGGRVMADLDATKVTGSFVGSRVSVLVPTGERRAIVVPARYVVTRFGVDYVRLLQTGNAWIDAPVQRGTVVPTQDMPDGLEILAGLRDGDRILPNEDKR